MTTAGRNNYFPELLRGYQSCLPREKANALGVSLGVLSSILETLSHARPRRSSFLQLNSLSMRQSSEQIIQTLAVLLSIEPLTRQSDIRAIDSDIKHLRIYASAYDQALARLDTYAVKEIARALSPCAADLARILIRLLDDSHSALISNHVLDSQFKIASQATAATRLPARPAKRLIQGALNAIPPVHRSRYTDELLGELQELVNEGASRRTQLAHSFRIASRVYSLRRALSGTPASEEAIR